jgi:hypothetical protein
VDVTLQWIQEKAPIVIPIDLETVGHRLADDTHFRNQFELESCEPLEDLQRNEWEEALFSGAYRDASPSLRCKYGILNIANDKRGARKSSGCTTWSYLQLHPGIRHRATLTPSATGSRRMWSTRLGTMDYYAHVFEEYSDAEFQAAIEVGTRRSESLDSGVMNSLKEVQIHGEVNLSRDIEVVMVHPKLRSECFKEVIEKLAKHCKAPWVWLEETAAESKPAPDSEDEAMEMALMASLRLHEDLSSQYHQREAEDLARALALSTPSVPALPHEDDTEESSLAKAIEASITATATAVAAVPSPSFVPSAPPADTLPAMPTMVQLPDSEYVLKASLENDVRRFRLSWPTAAGAEEITSAIREAVQKSFDLEPDQFSLTYEDEDGDACTLVAATAKDYMASCKGSALKKVHVCRVPQKLRTLCRIPQVSQVHIWPSPEEAVSATDAKASNNDAVVSAAVDQEVISNQLELRQQLTAGQSQLEVLDLRSGLADINSRLDQFETALSKAEEKEGQLPAEDSDASTKVPEADEADRSSDGSVQENSNATTTAAQEFSIVTPPSSPRGFAPAAGPLLVNWQLATGRAG